MQECDDFRETIDHEPDGSVHLSKRPRTSTVEDPSWCSSHHSETQSWEEYSYFDSAWEDGFGAEPSTLRECTSPGIRSPGHAEPVSLIPTPDKNWDSSSYSPLDCAALQPGLGFTVDVSPASDYELGLRNHSFLSFSGSQDTTTNATLFHHMDFSFEHQDSIPFNRFGSVLPKESSSSSVISGLTPPPHDPGTSHPLPVFGPSQHHGLPKNCGPSRVPLSPLPRLKCPQCPRKLADKLQLR